jgi:hypothetical protein
VDQHSGITDAELDQWEQGQHKGHRNSVEYLRPLSPAQRYTAYWEAQTRQNFTGGTFSGNVCMAVEDVAAGRTPYSDMAETERQAEAAKPPAQRAAEFRAAIARL